MSDYQPTSKPPRGRKRTNAAFVFFTAAVMLCVLWVTTRHRAIAVYTRRTWLDTPSTEASMGYELRHALGRLQFVSWRRTWPAGSVVALEPWRLHTSISSTRGHQSLPYQVGNGYTSLLDWEYQGFAVRLRSIGTSPIFLSAPCWSVLMLLVGIGAACWLSGRRASRFGRGQCAQRAYDLRDSPSGICPECGTHHE